MLQRNLTRWSDGTATLRPDIFCLLSPVVKLSVPIWLWALGTVVARTLRTRLCLREVESSILSVSNFLMLSTIVPALEKRDFKTLLDTNVVI